jgi:hypothetical protein
MMMRLVLLGCFLATAACGARHTPVPVTGDPADVSALAGEWRGTYESTGGAAARGGSIMFRLEAGRDTAYGEVLMAWQPEGVPVQVQRSPDAWQEIPQNTRIIEIRFVRSSRGEVTGVLEPYEDPLCSCTMLTRFSGHLEGDVVAGTFTSTRRDTGVTTGGRWSVTRYTR